MSTFPELLIGGLEPVGLGEEQDGRVSAVARALDAQPLRIGDAHLDDFVDRRQRALGPSFAGISGRKVHRGVEDRVARRR